MYYHSAKHNIRSNIFKNKIINVVPRQSLPLSFIKYEGVRNAFHIYASKKGSYIGYDKITLKSDMETLYKYEKNLLFDLFINYASNTCLILD